MSWFTEFSEKAENILNSIDKNAAVALNKQTTPKNKRTEIKEPAATIKLEDELDSQNQSNHSYSSYSIEVTPSDEPVINLNNYSSLPAVSSREKNNEPLQNEMLQNEIHSLNNEISLLLNRAKIAEQSSANLNEKLVAAENRNSALEEQISKLMTEKYTVEEMKEIFKYLEGSERIFSHTVSKTEKKNSIHDHYDSQIQELLQQKSSLEESLRSKDDEIILLKSRLSQKTYCFSAEELQSRLRALTITLVQKQSSLDSLTTEKNTLLLKYNQLQKRYDDVLGILHQSRVNMNDTDDVKARIPAYNYEKGFVSRLKRLTSPIDSLSVRTESLLRKSSFSRIFFLFYLITMHAIVFLLMYSHMPESSAR